MPAPTFDAQDQIPEPFRDSYVEKDGKWVINDAEFTAGLRDSQRKLLDEKKKISTTLDSLLGGRSLDEVKSLLAKTGDDGDSPYRSDDTRNKSDDAGKWAAREKKLRDEMQQQLAPLLKDRERLQQREFEDTVWEAAKAAGALESDKKLVLKMAKDDYVTRDPQTGKIVVLDEYGEPSSDDLKALFEGRFKKENAKLYGQSVGSGGGANGGSSTGGRRGTANQAEDMTDFVSRITTDKDALAKAKAGQFTVRPAA